MKKKRFTHPPSVPCPGNLLFELVTRQMPLTARMSAAQGVSLHRHRRVLDPPPTIELACYEHATASSPVKRVKVPLYQLISYTLFATLVETDADIPITVSSDSSTSVLTGSCISSLFAVTDPETDQPTLFFVFTDLGVRRTGTFRIRLTLCRGEDDTRITSFTPPFEVVPGDKFGGVQESTPLTIALADHGVHVRKRKQARPKTRRPSSSASTATSSVASASNSITNPYVSSTSFTTVTSGTGTGGAVRPMARRTPAPATHPYPPPKIDIHAPQPLYPPHAILLVRAPTPRLAPGPVAQSPNYNGPSTSNLTATPPPSADLWAGLALDFGLSLDLALVEEEQPRFDPETCYFSDWFDSSNPLAFDAFKAAHGLV
ncbi:velvet factor-domain-containing protein [Mycena epipterygia]|nr:velvet factor-domain-containing protein [Mycena epipterygia]